MVKRSVQIRLQDILNAIDEIGSYLESADFDAYERDAKTRRAVERCVEIISEASRHIPRELTDRFPDVPWAEVRAIGNILRHDYQRVAHHVMWRTATKHVSALRIVIVELEAQVERDEDGETS